MNRLRPRPSDLPRTVRAQPLDFLPANFKIKKTAVPPGSKEDTDESPPRCARRHPSIIEPSNNISRKNRYPRNSRGFRSDAIVDSPVTQAEYNGDSKPRRRSIWAAPEDEDFSAGSMGSLNPASRMHQQIRSMDAKNKRKYTDRDGNEKGDKLQDQKQGPANGFVNIHCPRHDCDVNSVRYNNFKSYY